MTTLQNAQVEPLVRTMEKFINFDFNGDVFCCFKAFTLGRTLQQKYTELAQFRDKLQRSYFVYNERGVVYEEGEPNKPVLKEGKDWQEYIKDLYKIMSVTFEIPYDPFLQLSMLKGVPLTMEDFASLQPFILE